MISLLEYIKKHQVHYLHQLSEGKQFLHIQSPHHFVVMLENNELITLRIVRNYRKKTAHHKKYKDLYLAENPKTGERYSLSLLTTTLGRGKIGAESDIKTFSSLPSEPFFPKKVTIRNNPDQTLVMHEWIEGDDLEYGFKLGEEKKKQIATEIAKAFIALKKINLLHNDYLPRNCILSNNQAVLIDYGTVTHYNEQTPKSGLATFSPECLKQRIDKQAPITTEACNIWNLGIFFDYLFTQTAWKEYFYGGVPDYESFLKRSFHLHEILPDSPITPLLKQMLDPDPKKRPTIEEVLPLLEQLPS